MTDKLKRYVLFPEIFFYNFRLYKQTMIIFLSRDSAIERKSNIFRDNTISRLPESSALRLTKYERNLNSGNLLRKYLESRGGKWE